MIRFYILCLSCLLVGFLVFGTPDARAAVFYPTSFTLANGLQVVVVPNHLAPVVTQMVWYKVGSSDEVKGKTGLAHYLEHLMFRGTSSIGPGEFSKSIAAQGGEDNAFTAYDYTSFHETVAADRLPLIMQMEADRMQNLRIMPETATPELSVVLDERQQRTDNSPEGRFQEKVNHILMPHYPYGIPVIGWKKEIEKLTVEDAKNFYEHHYAPNNAIVVISGDVTPEEVMRLAASIYGSVPKRDVLKRQEFPVLPLPKKSTFTMMDAGVEQPQIQLQIVVPSRNTAPDKAHNVSYAYEILAEILDNGESGLLYKHFVRDREMASGVEAYYDPSARGHSIFSIALIPAPKVKAEVLQKELTNYLHGLSQSKRPFDIDESAVAAAKQRLVRSAVFARDSLMTPGYAFGMALSTGETVADVEAWPDRINAVSVDEVQAAFRELVDNPHALLSALLPDPHASAASREAARSVISHDMSIR